MRWNGVKWEREDGANLMQAARHVVKCLFDEARDAQNPEDTKLAGKWAITSQSRGRIEAMIKLAESEPEFTARVEDFDKDSYSLHVENGIIDLRTGSIRPHEHDALFAKIAGTPYSDDEDCPKGTSFISRIMGGSDGLIKFRHRAVEKSVTGREQEE